MLLPTSLSPSPSVSLLPYPPMSPSPSVYLPTSPYVSLSFFLSPPPMFSSFILNPLSTSFPPLCLPSSSYIFLFPLCLLCLPPHLVSLSSFLLPPISPSLPLLLFIPLPFVYPPPLCLPPSPLSSPLPLCLSCFQSPPFQSPPPFLPLSTLFPPIPYLHDVSHTPLCLTAYLLPPLPPLFLHPFPYVFIPSCLYPSHLPPPYIPSSPSSDCLSVYLPV